jgi:hypothetical protein
MVAESMQAHFAICLRNDDYPASLEPRKVYRVVHDDVAASHQMLRIVDESGEDYLYPETYFAPLDLPAAAESMFSTVS